MADKLKVRRHDNGVSLETENGSLYIRKAIDNDIWFNVSMNSFELNISNWSRDSIERRIYALFETLMKGVIGRYVLSGDYGSECNGLPEDFIDLNGKTIVWHSDSGVDDILWLEYNREGIKVFVSGNVKDKAMVRIRTNGSAYGYYYQEFEEFYRKLCEIAYQLEKTEDAPNLVKKL